MVENGKRVKIHYTLRVEGNVVATSRDEEPLEYQHGSGQILPSRERVLTGLNPGDTREVHIGPEDAYGPIDPRAIVDVPKERIQAEDLREGTVLQAKDPSGKTVQGMVREVHFEKVTVDFNHPLAGKELHFEIEIIEVS